MAGIKIDDWFKQDYSPAVPDDEEEDTYVDDEAFSMSEMVRTSQKLSFNKSSTCKLLNKN